MVGEVLESGEFYRCVRVLIITRFGVFVVRRVIFGFIYFYFEEVGSIFYRGLFID